MVDGNPNEWDVFTAVFALRGNELVLVWTEAGETSLDTLPDPIVEEIYGAPTVY